MRKILFCAVVAFAGATAVAHSADLQPVMPPLMQPAPMKPIWTGFYAGLDGGAAWQNAYFDDLSDFNGWATDQISKLGALAGGYAGYNWQSRSFVYGLEADANWVDAKAQKIWGAANESFFTLQQSQKVDWLATFRGRAGLDIESTLVYLTAGLALGGVNNSFNAFCPMAVSCFAVGPGARFAGFQESETRVGWIAGVGFEHMFDMNWSVRGELRYADLGVKSVTCVDVVPGSVCSGTGLNFRGDFSNAVANGLLGVGYKF